MRQEPLDERLAGLSEAKRKLLAKLLEQRRVEKVQAAPRIPRRAPGAPAPTSFVQERLWFLEQLTGADPVNNMSGVVRVRGDLDLGRRARAFAAIVERHQVLRTAFPTVEGRPLPSVRERMELPDVQVDLRHLGRAEREARAAELMAAETRRPFDLAQGPLLRAMLIRLADDECLSLLTFHHAVADGVSIRVLFEEFMRLYQGASLPELPIQYGDYAAWQRRQVAEGALGPQLEHWRRQLGGRRLVLELPADHVRPPRVTSQGARVPARIDAGLTAAIRQRCREQGVTPFMFLMAAYAVLLHRYTGEADVAVGTAASGRHLPELRGLIGCFLNMLVLRMELGENPTLRELVRQVQRVLLEAYDNQDVPFEKLVEELNPERDLAHLPLYQVALSLEDQPAQDLALAGLEMHFEELDVGTARADLLVDLVVRGDELAGAFEYRSDLFRAETVERMVRHFETILRAMVADPERRVGEVDLLTPVERRTIVEEWNRTEAEYPRQACIHGLVEAQARRTPDLPAATDGVRSLTYQELDRRANQLARHLRSLGVGVETPVGVAVGRTVDTLAAVLAVLKAGGTYVPLDPAYPAERLAFMIEDAGIPLILAREATASRIPGGGSRVVLVDRIEAELRRLPADPVEGGARADDRVYVIYTSGSTGRPKGVEVLHRGLCNVITSQARNLEIEPGSRVLQFASLSFDASAWEIFTALTSGATLFMAEPESLSPGLPLLRFLRENRITHATLPSSGLALVPREPLEDLRTLVVAGEACPNEVMAAWCRGRRFINAYGPTENSICATTYLCTEASPKPLIGRAIPNVLTYVLDRYRRPVPVGVPGELFLGGESLARGYLGRPELTAERFIEHSFDAVPASRLYRTGDIARYLPDGNIEFLGRTDEQVKIHGYRIELGEIEGRLAAHPGVKECAVVVRQDRPGEKRLAAYVAAAEGVTADVLRAHVLDALPTYMLPAHFVFVSRLPVTASGKIDRRALPAPAPEAARYAEPATDAERAIAGIWSEVIGVPKVGTDDNFFQLGGDSILSIQVVAKARAAGWQIGTNDVFKHQTVRELAAVARPAASPAGEQGPVTGEAPLAPIQRWFLDLAPEHPEHWNQAVVLEVGAVDRQALQGALAAIWAHHDALRATFRGTGPGATQILAGAEHAPALRIVDLSSTGEGERKDRLRSELDALHRAFDLSGGPLLAAAMLEPVDGKRLLALVAHHLVIDAVSWRILLEDLQAAYLALAEGRPVSLPPKTSSYKAWCERLAAHARTEPVQGERALWLEEHCRPLPPLPVDAAEGDDTAGAAEAVTRTLAAAETAQLLRELPMAHHTEVQDALLAGLGFALARWTGRQDFRVFVEGHGREPFAEDLDPTRTVGWFTTLYPVVLHLDPRWDPATALRTVKERLRQVPANGFRYGLLRWLDARAGAPALEAAPEISFNYLGQLDRAGQGSGVFSLSSGYSGQWRSAGGRRPFLLEVIASVRGGELVVECAYGRNRHRRETVERLMDGWIQALQDIVRYGRSVGAEGFTPSDFAGTGLLQGELDELLSTYG